MRRSALQQVGGWDEDEGTRLTEDISTSLALHALGWQSVYIRSAYTLGISPPSLDAFWNQQRRWATGGTHLLFKFMKQLWLGKFKQIKVGVLAFYFLSLSYYSSLFALSLLLVWPTLILLINIFPVEGLETLSSFSQTHLELSIIELAFISLYPVYALMMFFPHINMMLRGHRFRNMLLLQSLITLSAPEYLKGVRDALFKKQSSSFNITLKTLDDSHPLRAALFKTPQFYVLMILLTLGGLIMHLVLERPTNYILWIILFWFFVNTFSLSHLLVFRSSKRKISISSKA